MMCNYGDPHCPCQDGDPCHYEGDNPMVSRINRAATPEPPPKPGNVDIPPLVIEDIKARQHFGIAKYGTPLQAHNGRDALTDAYQEALDEERDSDD